MEFLTPENDAEFDAFCTWICTAGNKKQKRKKK
jgi:hypothetical protein